MAAEHWFRWHHGTVNDPKWRVVAARASAVLSRAVTVGHVLSIWACMLECASQGNPRGTLSGWDDEDVGAGLGIATDEVVAIREAMQGKTLDGLDLTGWKRRQPKVEDTRAAERKARQRERDKAPAEPVIEGDNATSHGMSREVTTETETETEEKKEQSSLRSDSSSAAPQDQAGGRDSTTVTPIDKAARLGEVTDAAVAAYNASKLVKANGGLLPGVNAKVGREERQRQVKRCVKLAAEICLAQGDSRIPPEFWAEYFALADRDDFHAGRQPGGKGHENWLPDFEFLTRRDVMLKLFEREDAA